MVCPEGWLDWDTYGVLIQAQSLSLAIKLTITRGPLFLFVLKSSPRKPHYVELSPNRDKVLTDTLKFWGFCRDIAAGSWTVLKICFPSCVICHSHFFVLRDLLTHWKCTKECNKDMCHTLHPYYGGNDKRDRQSLRHTVAYRSALLQPASLVEWKKKSAKCQ